MLLGLLLVAAGLVGLWLSRDEASPAAGTTCPTPSATPSSPPPAAALPAPAQVRVVLLNGTARPRLAEAVGQQLRARGFVVLRAGNAPAALAGASVVTYAADGHAGAELLGRHVHGARLGGARAVPAGTVQLVLGSDFQRLATPAEVLAAAASPAPSGAPSASPAVARCP